MGVLWGLLGCPWGSWGAIGVPGAPGGAWEPCEGSQGCGLSQGAPSSLEGGGGTHRPLVAPPGPSAAPPKPPPGPGTAGAPPAPAPYTGGQGGPRVPPPTGGWALLQHPLMGYGGPQTPRSPRPHLLQHLHPLLQHLQVGREGLRGGRWGGQVTPWNPGIWEPRCPTGCLGGPHSTPPPPTMDPGVPTPRPPPPPPEDPGSGPISEPPHPDPRLTLLADEARPQHPLLHPP